MGVVLFVLVENTLPIVQDDEFIPTFHQDAAQLEGWTWPQLGAAVQFAWGLTLRMCSQYAGDLVAEVELLVEDDAIVTMAILNDAFDFLKKTVVGSRNFYEEVCLFLFACVCKSLYESFQLSCPDQTITRVA